VLIVDTGPLLATADRSDRDYVACRELLETDRGPLVTTALVVAEAGYLIDRQLGPSAEATPYDSIVDGSLVVEDLGSEDWQRVRELVTVYENLRLGGTDASLVAIAERLGATRIATLNVRHFSVVRPRHTEAWEPGPPLLVDPQASTASESQPSFAETHYSLPSSTIRHRLAKSSSPPPELLLGRKAAGQRM